MVKMRFGCLKVALGIVCINGKLKHLKKLIIEPQIAVFSGYLLLDEKFQSYYQ